MPDKGIFRSRFARMEAKDLLSKSWDIQESFQTIVVILFPIAFPTLSRRRFLPCKIPIQPWEHTDGSSASRKFFFWQYLPTRTLAISPGARNKTLCRLGSQLELP